MKVNKIEAKNIIVKSNLPDADYVINPYTGCSHNCIYCYARFMKRFTGHPEKWGSFVDVKVNATDLIPKRTNKYQNKKILLSSVTDPYLHLEKEYQLTRNILKNLIKLKPKLNIQTKSDLVLRDIDILKEFQEPEIGFTIITLKEKFKKELEQNTVSIKNRIKALKRLKELGFKTYLFIGPIFPKITNWKDIIEQTKPYTDFYMLENINIRGCIYRDIYEWLEKYQPELIDNYDYIFKDKKSKYWQQEKIKIKSYCKDNNLQCNIYFDH